MQRWKEGCREERGSVLSTLACYSCQSQVRLDTLPFNSAPGTAPGLGTRVSHFFIQAMA